MSKVINIYEAKTHLSKYVKQAKAGKPVYIGSYGKEEVMLVPVQPHKKELKLGIWKNKKIDYTGDIVGPDPEIAKLFKESRVMPDGSF